MYILNDSNKWAVVKDTLTFQLNGKYKKLTIAKQTLTGESGDTAWHYSSYLYVDVDGVRKHEVTYSSSDKKATTDIEVDLAGGQTCQLLYTVGSNGDYAKIYGEITDILFV